MLSLSKIPKIDAVVTAYNEPLEKIAITLNSLLTQTIPFRYIYLVDDGSFPAVNLGKISVDTSKIILLTNKPNLGISISRNRAIALSDADYIACVNVEIELKQSWLSTTIVQLANDEKCGCVFTRIIPYRKSIYTAWRFRFQEQKQPSASGVFFMATGHAVLFRRVDLIRCGGYNPGLKRIGEDYEISKALERIGLHSWYIAEQLCISHQSDSPNSLADKQFIRLFGSDKIERNFFSSLRVIFKDFSNRILRNFFKLRWQFLFIDFSIFILLLFNMGYPRNNS